MGIGGSNPASSSVATANSNGNLLTSEKKKTKKRQMNKKDNKDLKENIDVITFNNPKLFGCGGPPADFVYCNFNKHLKFSPDVFRSWLVILQVSFSGLLN
jgi:hypothetical protein